MSDIESANYSETAGGNNAASPDGAPEGMAPSGVNDTIREIMGAIKRDWNRSHPTVASGGAANAQTLTYGAAPAGYFQGQRFCFIAGFGNTGAATLNVNGIGARAIQLAAAALTGGEIVAGQMVTVAYDGTQLLITALPGHYRGGLIGIQTFGAASLSPTPPRSGRIPSWSSWSAGEVAAVVVRLQAPRKSPWVGPAMAGDTPQNASPPASPGVTVTVGAKGTGGTAGANNGTAGGTTSFGALLSATGGGAGTAGPAQGAPAAAIAAGAVGVGSNGAPNALGGQGAPVLSLRAPHWSRVALAGASFFGGGAPGANTVTGTPWKSR